MPATQPKETGNIVNIDPFPAAPTKAGTNPFAGPFDSLAPTNIAIGINDDDEGFQMLRSRNQLESRSTISAPNNDIKGSDPFAPNVVTTTTGAPPPLPPRLPPRNKTVAVTKEPEQTKQRADSVDSEDSLTDSEKAFRDSRRPPVAPSQTAPVPSSAVRDPFALPTRSDPFQALSQAQPSKPVVVSKTQDPFATYSVPVQVADVKAPTAPNPFEVPPEVDLMQISDDPFQDLTDALSQAESSSTMFKRRPQQVASQTPSSEVNRGAEQSRRFSEVVPDPPRDFIESPHSFKQANSNPVVSSPDDPFADIHNSGAVGDTSAKEGNQEKSTSVIAAETKGKTVPLSPTAKAQVIIEQQQQSAYTGPVLHEVYEAQAQQGAYLAMQAQVDSGVVFVSQEEQQAAYQAYYAYYVQYYLQFQEQQIQQHMQQQQQQMMLLQQQQQQQQQQQPQLQQQQQQQQQQTQQDTYESSIYEAQKAQALVQAGEAQGRARQLTQEFVIENQKVVTIEASVEAATAKLSAQILDLKAELTAAKVREQALKEQADEMEEWKAKYERLSIQVSSSSAGKNGNSDTNTSSVSMLTKQLEAEKDQNSKLKDKVKKYSVRIGAMEVLVAEAQIIKSQQNQVTALRVEEPKNKFPATSRVLSSSNDDEYNLM